MTYSASNFLISTGIGSDERVPRSNLLSSAMMSLQTSTHSSQMKTVGPAMSLRTSFWSLLQNEQRRTSFSPLALTIRTSDESRIPIHQARLCSFPDDIINDTVFLPLVGIHDVIPLRILLDTLHRLPRVMHKNVIEPFPHTQDFARRDVDIGGLAAQARHQRLMDHDTGIWKGLPFALGARRQQDRRH